jgi:hypothetical protein
LNALRGLQFDTSKTIFLPILRSDTESGHASERPELRNRLALAPRNDRFSEFAAFECLSRRSDTNAPNQPSSTAETADSLQPIDPPRMILLPLLLLSGTGSLFFGPGTLSGNVPLSAILLLFAVLGGEQLYRKWAAIS